METSAKTADNVEEAFIGTAQQINEMIKVSEFYRTNTENFRRTLLMLTFVSGARFKVCSRHVLSYFHFQLTTITLSS